jgi:clan AA aspartic protease
MGMTEVQLKISNPDDPKKSHTGGFLVDSGAFYTVLPREVVKKLALKPRFSREFILADGKKIRREIGNAEVKYGSEEIISPVVLGRKGDSALFGALSLEAFGLALDPFQRKIYKAKLML